MNLNKIIRSLDLSKSDARDKTIEGIIEYILYCVKEDLDIKSLKEYIKIELSLELYDEELESSLFTLIESSHVIKESNNKKYSLSPERELQLRKLDLQNKDESEIRKNQFKESIPKYSDTNLNSIEIDELWDVLTDYIYECYLEHGKSALAFFRPTKTNNGENNVDLIAIVKRYSNKLNGKLSVVFKNYIEDFANAISSESLDYLMTLANKSEAFFALGLSKEEYDHIYKDIVFDWTVFVDTNFLYSILDLHSNPENAAAKALLEIGSELSLKFKYLDITLKELQNKSRDFTTIIPNNLSYSQINALIKSEKLDSFSQRYFEKKIEDMDNTPHPSDVVNHAQNNLTAKKIDIYRSKFESLSSQEEYLKDQESKYSTFLSYLDEQRQDKGLRIKGYKDPNQIYHDIFLREAILHLRSDKIDSISDVKYFGVTEDKTLIKFDNQEIMRKGTGIKIPVFFSPALLLKRILKFSHVKSDNYRRAFISTISTPALENNSNTSKIAIRTVKYFHNMGISEEKMILNCIKDEIFLEKFKELENQQEELSEFVESQIQKQFLDLKNEYEAANNELVEKSESLENLTQGFSINEREKKKLESELRLINEKLNLYDKTLRKLKKQDPNQTVIVNNQLTIDQEKQEINYEKQISALNSETEKVKLKDDIIKRYEFKEWQSKSLWLLIPVVILLFHIFLIFFFNGESWNYVSTILYWANQLTGLKYLILELMLGLIFTAFICFPLREIYIRYNSKSFENDFMNSKNN